MRKQYMDFVPAASKVAPVKKTASGAAKGVKTAKTATARVAATAKKGVAASVKMADAGTFSSEKKPTLGAIESVTPKFVRTDVPKRPLSRGAHFTTAKTGVAAAKAVKVGNRAHTSVKPVEKHVENSQTKGDFQVPKTPFINQGKVAKRPLSRTSKNVYAKKVVVPVEEPKGPVTIITQPEKQAHMGVVVAIILTIILGAAAGTVAFLLLPR